MSMFTYGFRINKIFNNEGATAHFNSREIVSAIVNLSDAKKVLTPDEYFFVEVVFEISHLINEKHGPRDSLISEDELVPTTEIPDANIFLTIARPIPRDAPLTIATFIQRTSLWIDYIIRKKKYQDKKEP